ncbi:hypothetical protein SUGI_0541960 [Cryptomeria japonica]|nr:hypothetical protein SUGI_0541960 [Cryptomeria japonica]
MLAMLNGELKSVNALICHKWRAVFSICAIGAAGMLVLLAKEGINLFREVTAQPPLLQPQLFRENLIIEEGIIQEVTSPLPLPQPRSFRENLKLYILHLRERWSYIILIFLYIGFSAGWKAIRSRIEKSNGSGVINIGSMSTITTFFWRDVQESTSAMANYMYFAGLTSKLYNL